MSDVQILAAGSESIPYAYTVPNTQEVIPKAVSAIFDGTGAAAAFLPVLEIVSDAGIVVAQSPATQVAAGGSAEVSWFPRVGVGGSGSSEWPFAYLAGTSPTTCAANSVTSLNASANFYTNSAAAFKIASNSGIHGISITAPGHYLVSCTAGPAVPFTNPALYELQIAGGAGAASYEGGTSVCAAAPGGKTDQGRVQEDLLMTVTGSDVPTVAIIGRIVNGTANSVAVALNGIYAVQIDTDTTTLD